MRMIAADENAEGVPFTWFEFLDGEFVDDPGLAFGVDDHLLSGVGEDAAAALFVEHAVVVWPVGNDVALIAGDDPLAEVGAVLAAIVEAAIAAGSDFDLDAELEVLERAAAPDNEAVVLERAVRDAGETALLDAPVFGAAFPAGEVAAVEDGLEAVEWFWHRWLVG